MASLPVAPRDLEMMMEDDALTELESLRGLDGKRSMMDFGYEEEGDGASSDGGDMEDLDFEVRLIKDFWESWYDNLNTTAPILPGSKSGGACASNTDCLDVVGIPLTVCNTGKAHTNCKQYSFLAKRITIKCLDTGACDLSYDTLAVLLVVLVGGLAMFVGGWSLYKR